MMEKDKVLRYLMNDLKERSGWVVKEDLSHLIGEPEVTEVLGDLLKQGMIKYCGCGCSGFLISPKGIGYIKSLDEKFNYTPGPWFIEKDSWLKGHVSIGTKDHGAMIQVVGEMDWEASKKEKTMSNPVYARWVEKNKVLQANARLVAEAPELLELVRTANGKNGCHTVMWQEKAKEVLTKITGE